MKCKGCDYWLRLSLLVDTMSFNPRGEERACIPGRVVTSKALVEANEEDLDMQSYSMKNNPILLSYLSIVYAVVIEEVYSL